VRLKATKLGFGRRGRAMISISEASRRTGIARVTLTRWARAMRLYNNTQARSGHFTRLLTEAALARVVAAAAPRKRAANWGELTHPLRAEIRGAAARFAPVRQLPPACVVCGSTERPHKARDMCGACYARTAYHARKQGRKW
jgi:hypothetical protein